MFENSVDQRSKAKRLTRRAFLALGASSAVGWALWRGRGSHAVAAQQSLPAPHKVTIVLFSPSGQRQGTVIVPAVIKTEAEWKQQLPSGVFAITRRSDTEFPFTGATWNLHDKGLYRCICCDTALFSSDTKFESGTGWPSFWQPIARENVEEIRDESLGVSRTAVSCRRCESHLGHVFNDGPEPTGLRYCMNSASLRFAKFA